MSYYAVKVGRQTGIFLLWSECQKQITGFKGAVFKKFGTKEEAEKFITPLLDENKTTKRKEIYTDGSFLSSKKSGGYAVALETKVLYQRYNKADVTNNVCELNAILLALQYSDKEPITIYTDSEYCINVLQNGYKATCNTDLINKIKLLIKEKGDVIFKHVSAHIGIKNNELADKYANLAALADNDNLQTAILT